jgi:hypothetical protein
MATPRIPLRFPTRATSSGPKSPCASDTARPPNSSRSARPTSGSKRNGGPIIVQAARGLTAVLRARRTAPPGGGDVLDRQSQAGRRLRGGRGLRRPHLPSAGVSVKRRMIRRWGDHPRGQADIDEPRSSPGLRGRADTSSWTESLDVMEEQAPSAESPSGSQGSTSFDNGRQHLWWCAVAQERQSNARVVAISPQAPPR